MEDLCSTFFDSAGTPRLGGKTAWEPGARSRSGSMAVMPAADAVEEEEHIKAKPAMSKERHEILGLCSPDPQSPPPLRKVTWAGHESFDPQSPPPLRKVTWAGQDSFTRTEEPSVFFPDDPCSDSSSCAEGDYENASLESMSEHDRSDINIADRIDDAIEFEDCSDELMAAFAGECFTLDTSSNTVQMHMVASAATDEAKQNLLPADGFATAREFTDKPETELAVVDKAARWTVGQKMAVIVMAFATFVLGIVVGAGAGVHGHRAAALSVISTGRVPSNAVTLYRQPTTTPAAGPNLGVTKPGLNPETRYLGRTAAASAIASVGTLTSQDSPPFGHMTSKTKVLDEIDAQIQAVRSMRIAREIIEEVQGAWIEVTATVAGGDSVPGLLDGPGPRASDVGDVHECPPIALHQSPVGCFAKSLDRPTRDLGKLFEGLVDGPWI